MTTCQHGMPLNRVCPKCNDELDRYRRLTQLVATTGKREREEVKQTEQLWRARRMGD